jgi:hypothetical protein
MEFFLGSIITFAYFIIFNRLFNNAANEKIAYAPIFSQSRKIQLIKDYLIISTTSKQQKNTQSVKHSKRNSIKAFFWEDNVYWIENGYLVTARLAGNQIEETTKKRVDTHSLSKVELDKMIFIVDKLTEGNKNDSGNSGKQDFQ